MYPEREEIIQDFLVRIPPGISPQNRDTARRNTAGSGVQRYGDGILLGCWTPFSNGRVSSQIIILISGFLGVVCLVIAMI